MTSFFYITIAFLATTWVSSAGAPQNLLHIPEYITRCPRDSPNFDTCVLESLRAVLPYLVKGIPELELMPMDPFRLKEAFLEYHNGQIHARFGVKDYTMTGIRNHQFLDVRSNFDDPENIKFDIDVFNPKLVMDGRYKLQGKLGKSEFSGKGIFNVTMTDISATWKFTGRKEVIDGITFLRMTSLDMEPEVGDMKIYASNLFNGNEGLSRTALKLFNQNWRLVYKELLPFVKKDWDKMMTDFANRLFLRIPFDELFPPSQ